MKKFFILFLALTFVLSMAAFAVADDGGAVTSMKAGSSVSIGGDARVRGIWNSNYNFTDTATATNANDTDNRYWDQRVRLKVTADVGNGIELRTRIQTDTDQWNGTGNTRGGAMIVDYAYLHIPVQGVTIDAGLMKRNWGNKLFMWDAARDTFQITTNIGDTQLGLYTDKVSETNSVAGTENLEDYNNYGFTAVHNAGNLTAGLHIIKQKDNTAATDLSGTIVDVYLNTSVGAISIAAEIAQGSGDINLDTAGKKPQGGFIYASTDVGAINVNAFAAIVKNGFAADSHLTPTVFFGTDNPTAIADVQAADNSTTKAFAIGAGTDISSELSASAKLAYFDLENLSPVFIAANGGTAPTTASDESATEIDLGIKYKLADNAVYSIDFGYLMPDSITLADDNAMALAHKIEVSF